MKKNARGHLRFYTLVWVIDIDYARVTVSHLYASDDDVVTYRGFGGSPWSRN